MKTPKLFLFIYLFIFSMFNYLNAQDNYFAWAKQMEGESGGNGESITIDDFGNFYVTGQFMGKMDFDPNFEDYNLFSNGSVDLFTQKLDPDGNLIWVTQLGGIGFDWVYSITTDHLGNVYTTGYFRDTVDFDPQVTTYFLASAGGGDVFIQKLDPDGNFIWAKRMGLDGPPLSSERGYDITTDQSGNVYTLGRFSGTVDFDPGADTFNLASIGVSNLFIQKLDTDGNFIWAKQVGGINGEGAKSIDVDILGNVYIAGGYLGLVDFDPGLGGHFIHSNGSGNMFILKLNSSGEFIWVKDIGGTDAESNVYCTAMKIDSHGNIFATGQFEGSVDFDSSFDTLIFNSFADHDIFTMKLDKVGNLIWVKQTGGQAHDTSKSIAIDDHKNSYLIGGFTDTVDFDPSQFSTLNLTSFGQYDIYIQKLNPAGDLDWVAQFGGTGKEVGWSIDVDALQNIYATGYFRGSVDFDPTFNSYNLTSVGNQSDVFILKLTDLFVGIEELDDVTEVLAYPNPTSGILNLDLKNMADAEIQIFNHAGQLLFSKKSNQEITSIDFSKYNSGVYFVTIRTRDASFTKKIIKI